MKRTAYTALLTALLLAGCGEDSNRNNHGYGWNYDHEVNGLRVRYDVGPDEPPPAQIAEWFAEAVACADRIGPADRAGIPVAPPFVVIVAEGTADPFDGLTFYSTGLIIIERQWAHDRGLYVHEFEHWILYIRGVPISVIDAHQPIEFNCRFLP